MDIIEFGNLSNEDIEIIIDNETTILVKSKTSINYICKKEIATILVKEYVEEISIIQRLIGYFMAFFISIPLWFISYFEVCSIEKDLLFPAKFKINEFKVKKIEIEKSDKKFEAFSVKIDNIKLEDTLYITESELRRQINDYRTSIIISSIFPLIIVLFLLFISIHLKNIIIGFVFSFVVVILFITFIKVKKKNKKIINTLLELAYK